MNNIIDIHRDYKNTTDNYSLKKEWQTFKKGGGQEFMSSFFSELLSVLIISMNVNYVI